MVIITQEKVVIEKIFKKIRIKMMMKKFKKKIRISIIRFLKILSIKMKLTIHI